MKKYISAILIPCLLLQLYGCVTINEMTLEELKSYDGSEEINVMTNQDDYYLYRKSSGGSSVDWEATDNSIIIINKKVYLGNNGYIEIPTDSIVIKYSDIQKIETREVESEAWLVVGGVLGTLAILGLMIHAAADSFRFWSN